MLDGCKVLRGVCCLWKVLIVRPSSRCQLTVGTRVCAYWSEKFTCLHPGTVCQPSSDDDDDDDDGNDETLFSVDFDDGDAGKIPLDYVRMLPADFPLQRTFFCQFYISHALYIWHSISYIAMVIAGEVFVYVALATVSKAFFRVACVSVFVTLYRHV